MTEIFDRDGTSQAHRIDPALKPEFIAVDERTMKDWLAFAHAFSRELNYFDLNNQVKGDWSGFLPEELSLRWQEIEKFLATPEKFDSAEFDSFRRPHFVLFLAFLQLLKLTQGRLNNLTRQHLDYYFQEVLRLEKKQGIPDHVHIIVKASPYTDQMQLPAGILLNAGKDKLGKELAYRTDNKTNINHAQIEQLSSVFVHKQITGIPEAREQHQHDNNGIIEMLKIALGEPFAGDDLPLYPPDDGKTDGGKQVVDFKLLQQLQTLVKFVDAKAGLFLDLWELRSLMLVKNRQQINDDSWNAINTILEKIGKGRDITFNQAITGRNNFDSNLKTVLGGQELEKVDGFATLFLVNNIYDLYDQRHRANNVKPFIEDQLKLKIEDFAKMMELKIAIDTDWRYVNTLLEQAGKRQDSKFNFNVPPGFNYASPEFAANFNKALPDLEFPAIEGGQTIKDLDDYNDAIEKLEKYFYMKAEDFLFMMDTADTETPAWEIVYEKLANAHKEKIYATRRTELTNLKTQALPSLEQQEIVQNMIRLALDKPDINITDADLKDRIVVYLPTVQYSSLVDKITDQNNKEPLKDEEWQTLYELLELVWRNRLGKEPVAQKVEWLYLSANQDAKSIIVNTDSSRWHTFGQSPNTFELGKTPEAKLGWSISSPLLALSQGKRTITFTLSFQAFKIDKKNIDFLLANKMFKVQISSSKDWIEPISTTVIIEPDVMNEEDTEKKSYSMNLIKWVLVFDESIPAIAALPIEKAFIDSPYPILRLLLLPIWKVKADGKNGDAIPSYYPLFQSLLLERVLLEVNVHGLKDFQVQNDDTVLNSTKPFEPFGSYPTVGSRLYFGHSELVSKRLKSIDLNLQWMGVPNDLATHYTNYTYPVTTTAKDATGKDVTTTTQTPIISDNNAFKATLSLLDQNREVQLTEKEGRDLFEAFLAATDTTAGTSATTPKTISIGSLDETIRASRFNYQRDLSIPTDNDLKSWQRYFYLELNAPDFQHSAYPSVAAAKSIQLATDIAKTTVNADARTYQVNPPYTPKLKSFSINYVSSEEVVIADYQEGKKSGKLAERIFHQHPFGYAEIQPDKISGRCNFLPLYDNEGELYIGLNNVKPTQQLSMLMQMAEGSANPDLDVEKVEWSYLSGNNWISLHNSNADQGHIMSDATHGLLDSGIIELQLLPALPNTLLPPQLYWLRAAITKNCNSVCDTVGIHTQAVAATFVNQDNSPDHLSQPLPVNSISKTLEPVSDITAIEQPYTSFGGKPVEQDAMFNVRVSERLRHKQRALTTWDYEHLILEKFPQIYKAKCMPQTLLKHPDDLGKVEIIVIPDIRKRFPFNPFEPKAPAGLLHEIRDFLGKYTPPFANIMVKNAHYVPVMVRVAVRFKPNYDPEFSKRQLNEDINRFLAPWAYDADSDIVIGGSIYANAIINFIEKQDYIDYLAQFYLFSNEEGVILNEPKDSGYRVQAKQPNSVLVAAHEHQIDLITETRFVNENFTGINYMRIELDFIVG
ncbi:MAG: baseplate J/gp47 family protein [Methylococcales bacterium]